MDCFLEIYLDLDASRWLWSVLHYSCQLRIVVASFAELWQVECGSWRSVQCWMVFVYFLL